MFSCAFFGHGKIGAEQYRAKLLRIIIDLIENKKVTQFFSGFRGNFDRFCSNTVYEIKANYPNIKNTMVLSYIPNKNFILPECFDDSIYLLERYVPKRLAIIETNKCLVEKTDYIIAGIINHAGGACAALEYAYKRRKPIISFIDGWVV